LYNVSMIMGEAEIAGFQVRDVVHGLSRLTRLHLHSLNISGFSGVLVPANPACHLTNLRSAASPPPPHWLSGIEHRLYLEGRW